MVWDGNKRLNELPDNWDSIRRQVLNRDARQCRIKYLGCIYTANEVDHVNSAHDHSLGNLRAACNPCHAKRSSQQGVQEKARRRALGKRAPEVHRLYKPGLDKPDETA